VVEKASDEKEEKKEKAKFFFLHFFFNPSKRPPRAPKQSSHAQTHKRKTHNIAMENGSGFDERENFVECFQQLGPVEGKALEVLPLVGHRKIHPSTLRHLYHILNLCLVGRGCGDGGYNKPRADDRECVDVVL